MVLVNGAKLKILMIKILTYNVKGLRDNLKCREVFHYLHIKEVQGNTYNDYLRYGKHIIHEGYRKYDTSKAINYA